MKTLRDLGYSIEVNYSNNKTKYRYIHKNGADYPMIRIEPNASYRCLGTITPEIHNAINATLQKIGFI